MSLKAATKLSQVLTPDQVQALLDACEHLRDRLLLALLYDTGGAGREALGCGTTISPPLNGRSRWCAATTTTVPAPVDHLPRRPGERRTCSVDADYLHAEYGDLDSDYVFVNLWGRPFGRPWTHAAVYDLVRRLRRRTGLEFDPYWLRHTAATRMLRDGIGLEVVAKLLGHANVTVPASTYGHLTVEDARAVERAGWFDRPQVAW